LYGVDHRIEKSEILRERERERERCESEMKEWQREIERG
jgi:hypothetical protein